MGFARYMRQVSVVDGCQGGFVIVEDDPHLGSMPIASVNVPFKSNDHSREIAQFLADALNAEIARSAKGLTQRQ